MSSHAHTLSHVQVLANAGHFQIPDPTGHISKFGKLVFSPRKRFLLSIVTTVAGFMIVCVNYGLKGPAIPLARISGSGTVVPHTSLTVPVSGLFCESFTLSRLNWDNSGAAVSWNATVYIVPEKPPYYDQYNFAIANNEVTLNAANRWYMRYVHLHSGSEFAIKSCILEGAQAQVKVCVLRGEDSFKEWLSDLYSCRGSHMYLYELNACTENETAQTLSSTQDHHFVVEDSTYYFVHYAVASSSEVHYLKMNISVSSFDYDSDSNISCTTEHFFCTTSSIRLGLKGLAIITAVIKRSGGDDLWSYEDTIKVYWKCNPSFRGYILIFCIPILGLIGCCHLCNLCSQYNCCNRIRARLQDRRMPYSVRAAGHDLSMSASSSLSQQQPSSQGNPQATNALQTSSPSSLSQQQPSSQGNPQATNELQTSSPSGLSQQQPSSQRNPQANELQTSSPSDLSQQQPSSQGNELKTSLHRHTQPQLEPSSLDPSVALKNLKRNLKVVACISFSNITFLALLFTFLEAILPVLVYTTESNLVFTPGETRSFAINKFFCSSLSIDITGSSHLSASLWITEIDPQLTQFSNKTIVTPWDNFVCDQGCYEAWRSYMHPGSTLLVDAMNYGNSTAYFRSFPSEGSFEDFLLHSKKYIASSQRIEVAEEILIEFNATKVPGNQIFVLFSSSKARVKITLEFNRTEFSTDLSNLSHCELHSYTETNCKLPIPFGVGSVNGLLQVTHNGEYSQNYSYFEYLTVNTNCNYRADSWTLLWLPVMIVNIIIGYVLIGFILNQKYKHELKKIGIPAPTPGIPAPVATGGDLSEGSIVSHHQPDSNNVAAVTMFVPTPALATTQAPFATSSAAAAAVHDIAPTQVSNSGVSPSPPYNVEPQVLSPTLVPVDTIPGSIENGCTVEVHPIAEEGDVTVTTSETEPLLP